MSRWEIIRLRLRCWRVGHQPYSYPNGAAACARCYRSL